MKKFRFLFLFDLLIYYMVISDGFNSIINYIFLLSYFVLLLINIINRLCVLDSLVNGLLINYLINFVVILIYFCIKPINSYDYKLVF